jgi:hypothetical protein
LQLPCAGRVVPSGNRRRLPPPLLLLLPLPSVLLRGVCILVWNRCVVAFLIVNRCTF